MIFSSIPFLYYFLPMVLLLYYIVPEKYKNGALLLSSLVFYAWGEPKAVFLMVLSILVSYVCGRMIGSGRAPRLFFLLGVGVSLAFLLYFKYMDFFVSNFSAVTGISVPVLKVGLPVGISFYTFQLISYLIDVYRGTVAAQNNLVDLAAYVVMFPQLIAGPIVRYADIALQLRKREHSYEQMAQGIQRFVIGMGKKVLIADALGSFCSQFNELFAGFSISQQMAMQASAVTQQAVQVSADSQMSVLYVWLYGISFMLQIYFDFSGYSDMAIGLGKMFGFTFMENFDYPYISRSITEFWRRWHISLGSWFRDYIYIPLGGNRVSRSRWLFNILVVWMLTGFWHGASWNFILWGLYFAVLLLIEKLCLKEFLKKHGIFSHLYMLFFVMIGFMMFHAASVSEGAAQIGALFGYGRSGAIPLVSAESLYYFRSYFVTLVVAVVGATPAAKKIYVAMWNKVEAIMYRKSDVVFDHKRKVVLVDREENVLHHKIDAAADNNPDIVLPIMNQEKRCFFLRELVESAACLVLILLITAYFVDGTFSPFLYFRF